MTSVHSEAGETPHFMFADALPFGHEIADVTACINTADPLSDAAVKGALRATRQALRGLLASPDRDDQLAVEGINYRFLEHTLFSERDALPARYHGRKVLQALARTSYAGLLEFSQWSIANHARMQAAIDNLKPKLDEVSMERVQRLLSLNYIDQAAADMYEQTIAATERLHAVDWFEAGGMHANAWCNKDGMIGLTNMFINSADFTWESQDMYRAKFHEDTHALGARHRVGFAYGGVSWELLEETFAGHTTDVAFAKHPQPAVFNPEERTQATSSYGDERFIVALQMQYGPRPIPVEDVVEGFFAKGDQRPKILSHLQRRFDAATGELLPGYGGWAEFNITYEQLPYYKQAEFIRSAAELALRNAGFVGDELPPDFVDVIFRQVEG